MECERRGLFLKLLSLNLLLERPRLRLISESSRKRENSYTREWEETAEKALTHYKGDTQIVYMIAESLQLIGMKDEAIELLEAHLRIKPWDVHCLYQLGLIYQEKEEYEKAVYCYDKSLKSIEDYTELFRKNFSRLILESRQQVLEATAINQVKQAHEHPS
jgi:tetratricopeptide (TPR) repeat protein